MAVRFSFHGAWMMLEAAGLAPPLGSTGYTVVRRSYELLQHPVGEVVPTVHGLILLLCDPPFGYDMGDDDDNGETPIVTENGKPSRIH